MSLLVARSTAPAPATSGRGADLSGYGQTTPRLRAQPSSVGPPASSVAFVLTPLGRVLVVTSDEGLSGLYFDGHARTPALEGLPRHQTGASERIRVELTEYFLGRRTAFDIPLRLEGTVFQVEVWTALMSIPTGTTATYGEIARQLGRPHAARAVGAANGQNPISIVVPCHRLVGADGGLTGYGWGLERKRWLLVHERSSSGDGAEPRAGAAEVSSGRG